MKIKVLHLNIYHRLPDDFKGGVNDALRVLADHRESEGVDGLVGSKDNAFDKDFMLKVDENSKMLWPIFLEKIKEGFRTVGAMALEAVEYDL